MDLSGLTWHGSFVAAAAILGPLGCLVSLGYAVRIDHRDAWRFPMLVTAFVGVVAVVGAYVTGERALAADPQLARNLVVDDHRGYAVKLLLPTVGWAVMAALTGWVNPRTGALRLAMPALLSGFALVVLVLVVLSGDDGVRSLWERLWSAV